MPRCLSRAPAARWSRPIATLCLSLALGGSVSAADPARVHREPGRDGAIQLRVVPTALPEDPEAGLGLLQRIALLIERIFDDRAGPPAADDRPGGAADAGAGAEIISYAGPLEAGTVVINLDRFQVYRILGGGLAERYQEHSEAAVLARVGMAR